MAGLSALDFTRFKQLQTLQVISFNPATAVENGWHFGLPLSLRVLHIDDAEAPNLQVIAVVTISTSGQCWTWGVAYAISAYELGMQGLRPAHWRVLLVWHMLCRSSETLPTLTVFGPLVSVCHINMHDNVTIVATQGRELAHLTALQELRISVAAKIPAFSLQVTGIPPSLRHLEVVSCGSSLDDYLRLIVEAPAKPAAASSAPASWRQMIKAGAVGDESDAAFSAIARCNRPASAVAPLALVRVVLDYAIVALPASWPLPAACALNITTAFLTLIGEHAAAVGSDHEQVSMTPALLR